MCRQCLWTGTRPRRDPQRRTHKAETSSFIHTKKLRISPRVATVLLRGGQRSMRCSAMNLPNSVLLRRLCVVVELTAFRHDRDIRPKRKYAESVDHDEISTMLPFPPKDWPSKRPHPLGSTPPFFIYSLLKTFREHVVGVHMVAKWSSRRNLNKRTTVLLWKSGDLKAFNPQQWLLWQMGLYLLEFKQYSWVHSLTGLPMVLCEP